MNRLTLIGATAALLCLLAGCQDNTPAEAAVETAPATPAATTPMPPSPLPEHQRSSPWFLDAQQRLLARGDVGFGGAKNVILFLGDGMGVSTVTAGRIYAGQRAGGSGEEYRLSFEEFPFTGLAKTYNVDAQTPDSAGTMSAIVTGVKTDKGVFGVDERATRSDCASGQGTELLSLLSVAELAGKRTGIVTTTRLTHATPAATYASSVERKWEDDSDLSAEARAQGCTDIAQQFVAHRDTLNRRYGDGASDGIEVAFGGGRRHFLPSEAGGERTDGQNLVARWSSLYPGGRYVESASDLAAVDSTPVLGLFASSHIAYRLQREGEDDKRSQPGLVAMTEKAIDLLDDGNGFFLMVEAGRIDHAHHAGNAANALSETEELSQAVAAAVARTSPQETLIIVTADHSHVFTMAGYPRRGNPILGKVQAVEGDEPALDAEGRPYTTLGYMNGLGFRDYGDELDAGVVYDTAAVAGRQDIRDVDTTRPGYHQEVLVPMKDDETHGGEDVPVYARGPGALGATGNYEQNLLFHVMLRASAWDRQASLRLARLKP